MPSSSDWPNLPLPETPNFHLRLTPEDPSASARRAAAALPPGGILYYALGGGLGHLTRGLALARHLARRGGPPLAILTNCGIRLPEAATVLQLPTHPEPQAAELSALVRELVLALRPAVLAVDAFPAGILGELPPVLSELPCRKAAILRRLQPEWIERWRLPHLLGEAYDAAALVEPGADFGGLPASLRRIDARPVLIRDADELLPDHLAREKWAATGARRMVCAVSTGTRPGDQGLLGTARKAALAAFPDAEVCFATPFPGGMPAGDYVNHYPLMEWLAGVDLVIGPCGYHLCHETAAVGVPAIFIPQRRLYDDQWARAAGRAVARSPQELQATIGELLHDTAPRPTPVYENGAAEVACLLAELAT